MTIGEVPSLSVAPRGVWPDTSSVPNHLPQPQKYVFWPQVGKEVLGHPDKIFETSGGHEAM